MSLKLISHRLLFAGILASAVGVALAQPPASTKPATAPATAPEAAPAPRQFSIPPEIIDVNGTPLSSSDFIMGLYTVAGPRVLEEQINIMTAREACRLSGIAITQKDGENEMNNLLKNLTAQLSPPPTKELTDAEKGSLFAQFAQSQGYNPIELSWKIQQNTYLRALGKAAKDQNGKPAVNVTDEALNDEFERENGDRANVMVYIFPDREAAATVIADAAKEKKTFPTVADEKKIPREPVVIPTSDSVKFDPPIFKDTIKQLKDKDISAITAYTRPADNKTVYVVLYVDQVVTKSNMTPAAAVTAKAALKDRMIDAAELNIGLTIVNQMRSTKKIAVVINDPILAQYYDQLMRAQQEAATRNAPPAATAPATPPH